MGQRPKELTPHESLHHYWGAELRALRVARGLSLADLGQRVHCNPSYLGKIERGERPIPTALVDSCDRALDAHGTLTRLHALAQSGRELAPTGGERAPADAASRGVLVANPPGSLADGAIFPAMAGTGPESGEDILVPVRTADGRIVLVSVPRRVFLQGLGTAAVSLTAASATGPFAAALPSLDDVNPVKHFQQLRLVLRDNSMLFGPRQVISVVRQQIAIMQQLRASWRGTDQQELTCVQARYAEFCGWLHKDVCDYHEAQLWINRALGLSHLTTDRDLTAYILVSQAELAGDMRVAADATCAGEQAMRMASSRSRLAPLAAIRAARGYALSGDQAAMERTYDRARELLDGSDHDPDSPDGQWLTAHRIDLSQAHSWALLGDHRRAVASFHGALTDVPPAARLSRGTYLARAAVAHAGDRQVEPAAALGLDALAIAANTRSGRILAELAQLNDALAPWKAVPVVGEFRSAMKDTVLRHA